MIRSATGPLRAWARALACALTVGATLGGAARAAGPSFWDVVDFAGVELDGAALDSLGRVAPGLRATTALQDSSLVFWRAVVAPGGDAFLGSGHGGQIWRVTPDGEARLHAQTGATEIFSLLPEGDGLLAGCGPGGEVLRISAAGEAAVVGRVAGGYVWSLERGPDGAVYLATGSPAAIYRLRGDHLELVAELPAGNVLDLAWDGPRLLATTQGPGRVFALDPRSAAAPELLLQIEQDEARQLLRGPDGWYVLGLAGGDDDGEAGGLGGGSPAMPEPPPAGDAEMVVTADGTFGAVRSALYRLDARARVWMSDRDLMIAAWTERWGWLGGGKRPPEGRSQVLRLTPPNGARPCAAFDGGDVLDLVVRGDEVIAALAHPGGVALLRPAEDAAAALGSPLDGKATVRWQRLRWDGVGDVRFAVRTGASPTPDTTWSAWRDLPAGDDVAIDAAPSRYLQWRAELDGDHARVDALSVSGFAENLPPVITIFEQQPEGQFVMGGLLGGGGDNATQQLPSGLKIEYSLDTRRDRRLDRERAALLRPLRTFTWNAIDPNGDRLEYRLEYRRDGETTWWPIAAPTGDPVVTWDTTRLPDGAYDVRLRASDRPANPAALARLDERVLPGLRIDNTPPELSAVRATPADGGVRLRFDARDASPLAGAEVILPDGSRERLDPTDGVCDSREEAFDAVLDYPRGGAAPVERPWRLRALVWDLGGNLRSVETALP